jgi:hypothetical protein
MYNVRMAFESDFDLTGLWLVGADSHCGSCGATDWREGAFTAMPKLDPATGELDYEDGLPALALICNRCAFVRLHAVAQEAEGEWTLGFDGSNGAS